jgi:EpsI family protein
MTPAAVKSESRMRWASVLACVTAGAALFLAFGNATRGYIDTASAVTWWVRQWLNPDSQMEHGWVILALAAWLLARNWRARGACAGDGRWGMGEARAGGRREAVSRPGAGLAAMGGALALHLVGFVAQQTRLSIVALLLFTWGVLALADRRVARAAAFPLAFLVFAIPVDVLDSLGFWLRLGVIRICAGLAHAAGIDVVRSGTQLFAPDGRYQYDVAAACSGVRSLMALLALSLMIGYLNLRAWWRRAAVLGLALPLVLAGNVVRIGAIIVAAQLGGQRWGERAHDVMGFGVFAIVLGGVWLATLWLGHGEKTRPVPMASAVSANDRAAGSGRTTLLVAGVVVVMATAEIALLATLRAAPARGGAGVRLAADGVNPVALPAFVGTDWIGRRAEVTAVERDVLPADTGFSRRTYVDLRQPGHAVFFSVVLSGRDRTSIHRPELCLVGQGWTIASTTAQTFRRPGAGPESVLPATLLRTTRQLPGGKAPLPALVAYWFVDGDTIVGTHAERLWRDAWNRLRHGRADRWAYVLLQTDATDGEAAALARMQAVIDGVWPALQTANPSGGPRSGGDAKKS